MISAQAHAAILRRIAAQAVDDARAAWRKARALPDVKRTRSAFRACVFAAGALRQAAGGLPHYTGRTIEMPRDAQKMLEAAERLDAAANELKARLVRLVEGTPTSTGRG